MTHRSAFEAAIAAEYGPPSNVDVDGIVGRERRRRRYRAIGGSAGVAGAVAAIVFAIFGTGGAAPTVHGVESPAAPAPTTAGPSQRGPGNQPTNLPPIPTQPPDEFNAAQATRLSAVIEAKLRALLPGATFSDSSTNDPATGPFQVVTVPPEEKLGRYAGMFVVGPNIRDDLGSGLVTIAIGRVVGPQTPGFSELPWNSGIGQAMTCIPEWLDRGCYEKTGPNGEILVIVPRHLDENGAKGVRVDVTKPDGTGMTVASRNWPDNGQSRIGPPQRPEPSLTADQLVQLALDPGMAILV